MIDLSPYLLVIFDKDGTLIDFDAMWSGWIDELARRLETATGRPMAAPLFDAIGYDPVARKALAGQPLAVNPMAELHRLAVNVVRGQGLSPVEAETAVAASWFIPDPVRLAHPLADLPRLFRTLRDRGLKLAVVTTDDHEPTQATLAGLGVDHLVDFIGAADDGLPVKPAPDMVLAACTATGTQPAQSVVVGDSVADMQMARAAGAGLAIGVLSGTSSAADLRPHAHEIIPSIADLI